MVFGLRNVKIGGFGGFWRVFLYIFKEVGDYLGRVSIYIFIEVGNYLGRVFLYIFIGGRELSRGGRELSREGGFWGWWILVGWSVEQSKDDTLGLMVGRMVGRKIGQ